MLFMHSRDIPPSIFLQNFNSLLLPTLGIGFPTFHPIGGRFCHTIIIGDRSFFHHPMKLVHRDIHINCIIKLNFLHYIVMIVFYFCIVLFHHITKILYR